MVANPLFPLTSARVFYVSGVLTFVIECPAPPKGEGVDLIRSSLTIDPPQFFLQTFRIPILFSPVGPEDKHIPVALGTNNLLAMLGGDVPWPFFRSGGLELPRYVETGKGTGTLIRSFAINYCPAEVAIAYAGGHLQVKVEKIYETVAAPAVRGPEDDRGEYLKIALSLEPSEIYVNRMPKVPDRPQPHQVAFLMKVLNPMKHNFDAMYPNSGLLEVLVQDDTGKPLFQYPEIVLPVMTDASVAPGKTRLFSAVWNIDDARALLLSNQTSKSLDVIARFAPTGKVLKAQLAVTAVV